jgi:hypothetical protein
MMTHIWNTSPFLAIFWTTYIPFVALISLAFSIGIGRSERSGRDANSDIGDAVGPRKARTATASALGASQQMNDTGHRLRRAASCNSQL